MSKLKVNQLTKIFGKSPQKIFQQIQGEKIDKSKILNDSGHNVAVYNVDFSVKEKEIFVIMGLSGSGKSTVVRMLNGLIEPTAGSVIIDGVNISQLHEKELRKFRQEKISMVFQSFALMPHMSVIDNVSLGLEFAGVDKKQRYEKAEKVLGQMGLAGYNNSFPIELSGGMKQRVGLARALVCDTDIILMDEAFSALDPIIRNDMQDEILKLQDQVQKTIIFISHDIREAAKIATRMAIMRDGQIVQIGTPSEILESPVNNYVADFFKDLSSDELVKLRTKTVEFEHQLA